MAENISAQCCGVSVGPTDHLFSSLIQTVIAAKCSISPPEMWPTDYGENIEMKGLNEYDFIVIGAGSTGSVVAGRLSENPEWNVLLLEAGGDPPMESEIPSMSFSMMKTPYDWGFHTEKSNVSGKCLPNGSYWPRGKMLGGTSSMNGMIYIRGIPQDYDDWEKMGNPGWGWNNVLEYFKKSEDNQNESMVGKYHGSGGPLKVENIKNTDDIRDIFCKASEQLGYPQVDNLTSDTFIGFAYGQSTVHQGARWSPLKAFVNSAKDRKNLNIIKHAHVSKINFNNKKEVESVTFVRNGSKEYTIKVKKEVIVSAGAVNSPQILMLSGIGPEKHLKEHKIDVIENLPVGLNLRDHVGVPLIFTLNKSTAVPVSKEETMNNIYFYAMNRTGPLAGTGGSNLNGMINSTNSSSTIPDIQLYYITFRKQAPSLLKFIGSIGYDEHILQQIGNKNEVHEIGFVFVTILRPESVGEIKLRSSKYNDKPKIYPNYFTEKADIDTLTRGIRKQLEFVKTKVFQEHEGAVMKISIPDCDQLEYDSDAYWECYIRNLGTTIYHPSSTAKMGPENDKNSVVNSRLQVKGVKKLRVADASIMPRVVSGSPNAACIMIGEKASDFIKEDYSITKK